MVRMTRLSTGILAASLLSCGNDVGDSGTAVFTTWGEPYIEQQLPADPSGVNGFVDGWSVKYDKFLVAFHEIQVGDRRGEVGARMVGSKVVDNAKPGRKTLATFNDIPARRWDAVGYIIKPAFPDSDVIGAELADRDMMARDGLSIFVRGTATSRDGVIKRFSWGFKTVTIYTNCRQPAIGGQAVEGIVISNGGTDNSDLTTRGDHFFYDRLVASPDPAMPTQLRFDAIALADRPGDGFGEITLEELSAAPLPLPLGNAATYDPTGLPAPTLGEFVTELARTVGHFRGEGECTTTAIR